MVTALMVTEDPDRVRAVIQSIPVAMKAPESSRGALLLDALNFLLPCAVLLPLRAVMRESSPETNEVGAVGVLR